MVLTESNYKSSSSQIKGTALPNERDIKQE
jgi:hypothetical protein